jgi:acetylornithine deacetylase/succinyl-diaminopimelate desuccinylase family protein
VTRAGPVARTVELSAAARRSVEVDAVVPLAQRLVRVFTENPPGATRAGCDVLAAELEHDGFECELFEPAPGHVSLLATHTFEQPGRTLALNGHLDVVPATDGWTRDPVGGEIEKRRLYGRGALDMKGAVAAMAIAARSLVRARLPLKGRLVLMAVADEEQGGRHGSGALVQSGKVSADAVVIGEPSDGTVVIAHRGPCFIRLRTHGRATHASMPQNGVNAVERMVDALVALRSAELTHEPHLVLGGPSMAIGTTITGGRNVNIIPDRCEATLDVRTVPGMTSAGVLDDLHATLARRDYETPADYELEIVTAGEAAVLDPESELAALAVDALERELGRRPALGGMAAATDGWWFANRAGIPTIMGLGPGSIARCHVADEYVEVDELEAYARVYADLAACFLTAPPG